ncbi:hypothetical protein Goklo_029403 [Gossypium klotzschianum]|uniref:Retrotransposon gag domain-containing protein n=1 Tax=Gossypium klotzschianum TaxID=34286 RepID=A0A7J8W576_9ROSI|nr:hypothetical protein [Gossypium klotzschianum]
MDVPKPERFKGARSARDVDNFLREIESTGEKRGGNTIGTWEEFLREVKKQFYPQYSENEAWAKLRCLTHKTLFGNMFRHLAS